MASEPKTDWFRHKAFGQLVTVLPDGRVFREVDTEPGHIERVVEIERRRRENEPEPPPPPPPPPKPKKVRARASEEKKSSGRKGKKKYGPYKRKKKYVRPKKGQPLTKREQQVYDLAAMGIKSDEIAVALLISIRTVEVHFYNLLPKLGLKQKWEIPRHSKRQGGTNETH